VIWCFWNILKYVFCKKWFSFPFIYATFSSEEYYLRKFITHYQWIREAMNNIETANDLWKDRRKQLRRRRSKYKPGDLVLVKLINRRKLDPYFIGPLKILKKEYNTVTVCDPISVKLQIEILQWVPMKQIINNNKKHYDTKTQKLCNSFFIIIFSFIKYSLLLKLKITFI